MKHHSIYVLSLAVFSIGLLTDAKISNAATVNNKAVVTTISTTNEPKDKKLFPQAEDLAAEKAAQQKAFLAAEKARQLKAEEQAKAEQAKKAAATKEDRSKITADAQKYLGVPYVWGGKTPSGFDCSGFTNYVYREVYGMDIGSYTVPQEASGKQMAVNEAKPGDLLFWGGQGSTHHVAIYLGSNQYIHAPQTGDVVKISPISTYFMPDFAVHVAV